MSDCDQGHRASVAYHARMLADAHRMDAYERAIRALVRPGDVVLDLGAGTGVLAMLAARAGAARVHAVESMPIARLARRVLAANRLDERVVLHHADARTLAPIEPVDLVVSDFMGRFLVDGHMLPAVAAAGRWLKPGGRFCPARVELQLAPIAEARQESIEALQASVYGLDLRALADDALRSCLGTDLDPAWVLAPAQRFAEYRPPAPFAAKDFDATLDFTLAHDGSLRGLAGWFVAELAPGVTLSTAPGVETHWGQVFFPLPPVDAEAGDELRVRLRLIAEGEPEPDWAWSGELRRRGELVLAFDLDTLAVRADVDPPRPPAASAASDRRAAIIEATARGGAAFRAGDLITASAAWEEVPPLLTADDDDLVGDALENLGLAQFNRGNDVAAARNFLRALDGDLGRREQSLRFLIRAMLRRGRHHDALRYLRVYEQRFGRHPDGLTSEPPDDASDEAVDATRPVVG